MALLIQGAQKPIRVLCTREVQKSIKDSVHRLLSDQVQALGLGSFYEVLETEIRGKNGTIFLFAGLASHTVESIKSYEGIDRCWVEEGQKVTKRSWDILTPTIRKEGSEIWTSLNPDLDDDETYKRLIINPQPGSIVEKVNFSENPFFPEVLELERQHAERTMARDEYENIWLGNCKAAVDGAIYASEVRDAIEHGRICNVPYDPKFKVHCVFDLGWNDCMSIILAQRHLSEIRVIEYIEDDHRTLDWYSGELKNKRLNWGKLFLPHDGAHGDYKTGKSAEQIMRELGWSVTICPSQPVETGIKNARRTFDRVWFDKVKTERLVQCLRRYRRNISVSTNEPGTPMHDEYSHGADAFRYLSLVAPLMGNEEAFAKKLAYPTQGIV